ncbi:hypothetical protein Tco_1201272 [Tanacetum coccineum]
MLPVIMLKSLDVEEKMLFVKGANVNKARLSLENFLTFRRIQPGILYPLDSYGEDYAPAGSTSKKIPGVALFGTLSVPKEGRKNVPPAKDHFPLQFLEPMLERLAGNEYYCFLDGFSGYFKSPLTP